MAALTPHETTICYAIASFFDDTLLQDNSNAHIDGDAKDHIDNDTILSQRTFSFVYPSSVTIHGATLRGFKALSPQIKDVTIYVSMEDIYKKYMLVVETWRDAFFDKKMRSSNPLRFLVKSRPLDPDLWRRIHNNTNHAQICSLCMCICEHLGQLFRYVCPRLFQQESCPEFTCNVGTQENGDALVSSHIDIPKTLAEYRLNVKLIEGIHTISTHIKRVSFSIEAFKLYHRLAVTITIQDFQPTEQPDWSPVCPIPNMAAKQHDKKRKRVMFAIVDNDDDDNLNRAQRQRTM